MIPLLSISSSALAEDSLYLIDGLAYSPYERAVLQLSIGSKVDGELRPLIGDATAPIRVTGTNPSSGTIILTFHFSHPLEIAFHRKANSREISWEGSTPRNPNPDYPDVFFVRPVSGTISEAAQTIYENGCGPFYRTLTLKFSKTANRAQLAAFLESNPEIAQLQVRFVAYDGFNLGDRHGNFRAALLYFLDNRKRFEKDRSEKSVDVPIGSEAYITKLLRTRAEIFSYVNLDPGACGGAEVSYFGIKKSAIYVDGKLVPDQFTQYIDSRLLIFASTDPNGVKRAYRISNKSISLKKLPVPVVNYRVKLYVASEVGRQVEGAWDSFYVNFYPADLEMSTNIESAVIVEVEKTKTVHRSIGNDTPPDDTYFKTDLDYNDDAEITTALSGFFSRDAHTSCIYATPVRMNDATEQAIKSRCP